MPAQLTPFILGIAIGIGVGFAIWKEPVQKHQEYARNEAVDPAATKITEAKVEPRPPPEVPKEKETPVRAERKPVPKTPIAVRQKKQPGPTPEQLVAAHWNENIDADWSERSIESLRRDFEKLESSHPFTVNSIDCRKTSCITVLEWGRQKEAESAQPELLGAAYSLQCSKRLIFPPGLTKQGYQTTLVFFDCNNR